MKINYFIGIAAVALLGWACSPMADSDDVNGGMQSTRIAFSPAEVNLDMNGQTGEEEVGSNVIVTLNPDSRKKMGWEAQVDKAWCKIVETPIKDADGVTHRGFKVTTEQNPAYKRIAKITVKASDGTTDVLQVVQTGVYPDAEVKVAPAKIEFNADDITPVDVAFTSNMGEVYAVTCDQGADWISWEDLGDNVIRFTAQQWEDEANSREANVYITVGTEDTSIATATIPVTQLAKDIYCYVWGASLFDFSSFSAAQRMTKSDVGIYRFGAYFTAANGKNEIRINHSTKEGSYPAYALNADGKLVKLNSAADAIPAGPAIDIDGMRTLVVNLNDMSYTLTRIVTPNCMTDEAAAMCASKAFRTKEGGSKVWMTQNLDWNGGPDIGPMKLGSRLVPGNNAGGYGDVQPYPSRITDYDEQESGGAVKGSAEMTAKYGRLYTINEFMLGVPSGALSTGYSNVDWPAGYSAGDVFLDAAGVTVIGKPYPATTLKAVTDDEAFFAGNPALSAQIQGICPYGWHIANFHDWYDLAYAALEASRGDATYPVKEEMLTISQLVVTTANNVAPWLRTAEGWNTAPVRASGAEAFGFNLYPAGWRLYKTGYAQYGDNAHQWVPLIGSSAKKTWRLNNVTNKSNFWFNDNLDAGNPAVPIRCVKNYKTKNK